MAKKLTKAEARLIAYPPTQTTWVCTSPSIMKEGACNMVNSGKSERCWVCNGNRSNVLLWPAYEKACKKAGIDPSLGKPETPEVSDVPQRRKRRSRRRAAT